MKGCGEILPELGLFYVGKESLDTFFKKLVDFKMLIC